MSRGPGKLQRAVQQLITENQDGAWSSYQLCERIYNQPNPAKKHRVAVLRAVRRMEKPEQWALAAGYFQGVGDVLYNRLSLESTAKKFWLVGWPDTPYTQFAEERPGEIAKARDDVEEYTKYYESDELGRLDITIARTRNDIRFFHSFGFKERAAWLTDRLAAMTDKRQALAAAA